MSIFTTRGACSLPDIEGIVHGVKDLDPCTVQCDGCLTVWWGTPEINVLRKATFKKLDADKGARYCSACWASRGWVQGSFGDRYDPSLDKRKEAGE